MDDDVQPMIEEESVHLRGKHGTTNMSFSHIIYLFFHDSDDIKFVYRLVTYVYAGVPETQQAIGHEQMVSNHTVQRAL